MLGATRSAIKEQDPAQHEMLLTTKGFIPDVYYYRKFLGHRTLVIYMSTRHMYLLSILSLLCKL